MWISSSSDSARLHLVKIFVKLRLQKQYTSYLLHFGQVLQVSEMSEENKLIKINLRVLGHLLALKRLFITRNQFRNTSPPAPPISQTHLLPRSHPLPMVEQSQIHKCIHATKSFCFLFQTGKSNSARIKNRESKSEAYIQLLKPFNCYSKMIGLIPWNNLAVLMHRV